jgi:hypothetical protein
VEATEILICQQWAKEEDFGIHHHMVLQSRL